ncbi:MAG: hypothetical protein JWQ76_3846 [Ramlibacter sp.]|nr:hypothetical protein [Ramlibacter sp.]
MSRATVMSADLRRLLQSIFAVLAVACAPAWAQAPAWPNKPVHLLVPFPAGGPTDVTARIYADKLAARLNQPFVVENKPGPNGIAVYNAVIAAPADGNTLAFVTPGGQVLQPAINAYLKKPVEQDVNKLLAPVGLLAESPLVLVVSNKVPANTVPELLAWLKANAAKANYASDGVGSSTHLAAEMFNDALGIQAVHVPFKGTVDSMNAVMQGDAHFAFAGILTPLALHRAGKLKIIAIGGTSAVASLPGVPLLADAANLPGFDVSSWFALFAPKDTPPERVALLNAQLEAIARQPDVIEKFANLGLQPRPVSAAELAQRIQRDVRKWNELLVRTQLKLN